MTRRSILTGTLLLLLSLQMAVAHAASSAPSTLYQRIKNEVDAEITQNALEPEVVAYIKAILKDRNLDLTDDDINALMQNRLPAACGKQDSKQFSDVDCADLAQDVQTLASDEARVRQLGRDLQLSATSYELPVSDLPGRSTQLETDMRGIVNLWDTDNYQSSSSSQKSSSSNSQSSSASSTQLPPIRTRSVDDAQAHTLLQPVADALNLLSNEQRIAAVWHYQYGYRLTRGDRSPDYPAPYVDSQSTGGTERQYLFMTQPDVEKALEKIWQYIAQDEDTKESQQKDDRLSAGQTALYTFPEDTMKNVLPDNVIVWARIDAGKQGDKHVLGDVGLQWSVPLEPVLPSLLSDEDNLPILGGNYPPEPIIPSSKQNGAAQPLDGRGLCSDPTEQRGYLCRPYVLASSTDRCPDQIVSASQQQADPTAITLVTCQKPSDFYPTIAGPDVCKNINYATPAPFDPKTQCILQITCDNTVQYGEGFTDPKDANGVIRIHIKNAVPLTDTTLYHELHHAYQICNLPPNPTAKGYLGISGDPNTLCCEMEGEAFRAECDLAEKEGIFKSVSAPIDGIPVNAETCAEALTDKECNARGFGRCPTSRTYTQAFTDGLNYIADPRPNAPQKCTDLYVTVNGQKQFKDPILQSLIDKIQTMKLVSAPGTVTNFVNRIGNNICYIGQSMEESLELHRLTPAQAPANAGGESFPWNDPTTGKPLGNQLINPPLASSPLPLYRPQLLVQTFETSLCQVAGLPPQTPPTVCAMLDSTDLFNYQETDPESQAQHVADLRQQQQNEIENLLGLSDAVGAREGTDLYSTYMHDASRSFAQVLSMAVKLFKDMISVSFPTMMCPTDNTRPQTPASTSQATSNGGQNVSAISSFGL